MEKFDVFISFKNTDANGERTQDSFMAEELYYALKERNINAFYSNISISERGEHRFGKMIHEAIEQCSIFVAVGTSVENFESEWVEYERESFHDEMMNGNKARTRSAMYSFITKNVSTNRLPMELRRCQAFYELKDVVSSICARFQKENEVIHNFNPQKISSVSLCPGTLVDGKYKILKKIGQGGMSVVYLAMDERINKPWAIKVLRKEGVQNFEIIKQGLITEANLLKRLDHPNLPRIVDFIDADDSFVIIMDYIEGESLSQILSEYGAQPEESVLDWAKQLCDVLIYLHTRKPAIIYRDMKPANIMLRPNGGITLIDFGTAREFKEENLADTTCLGTSGYAAPEQFGGMGQTDARTDIYCLGVTLYNLVTNLNPAEPPYEIRPIREVDSKLSKGLEYVIEKATFRDPELRYQSIAEMLYDLENLDQTEKKANKAAKSKKINSLFSSDKKGKKRNKTAAANNVPFMVPKVVVPVQKTPDNVPVYSIPNPYSAPVSPVYRPNNDNTTTLPVRCNVTVDTDLLGRYSVFVTSTPYVQKHSEVEIRFYLATEENRDVVKAALVSEPQNSNFTTSNVFSLPLKSKLNIDIDSNILFLNKHRLCLTSENEMEIVRGLLSPMVMENECINLNINIENDGEILENLSLEFKVH